MKTNPTKTFFTDKDILLFVKKDYLRDFPKPKHQKDKQTFYRIWKKLPPDFKKELLKVFEKFNFSLIELIVVGFGSLLTLIMEDKEVDKDTRLRCERKLKMYRELSQ